LNEGKIERLGHRKLKQLKILDSNFFKDDPTEIDIDIDNDDLEDITLRKRKLNSFSDKDDIPLSKKIKQLSIHDSDFDSDIPKININNHSNENNMDTTKVNSETENEGFCSDEDLNLTQSQSHRVQRIRVEKGKLLPFDDNLKNDKDYISISDKDNTTEKRNGGKSTKEDSNNFNNRVKKVEKGILLPFNTTTEKDDGNKN